MIAVIVFLIAIVLANLSVAYFGPVSTPFNAFLLIGLDLSLRDHIHEKWHGKKLGLKMLGLVTTGAVESQCWHDRRCVCDSFCRCVIG